jgi:hypothetical protein
MLSGGGRRYRDHTKRIARCFILAETLAKPMANANAKALVGGHNDNVIVMLQAASVASG